MRALIAEDEKVAMRLMTAYLRPYAASDSAENGEEALSLFQHALQQGRPYDVVFLDIMMPKANGLEVLRRVRDLEASHGVRPSQGVKIVIATALSDEESLFEAHVGGCAAYLVKPFRRVEFDRVMLSLGYSREERA